MPPAIAASWMNVFVRRLSVLKFLGISGPRVRL